jgi:ParB family chromosome partitioning protein
VRTAEARARESNRGRAAASRRKRAASSLHPDQEDAAREIAEILGGALGADVRVRATGAGGYRAELSFSTYEEAMELARRLRPRAVA